jgi:hypothetical protein
MKPIIATFDNFFKQAELAHEQIVNGVFSDFVSPWDGVTYPGINQNLPAWVQDYVLRRLEGITGEIVLPQAMFARVTSLQTGIAPHKVHSDKIMGEYSAHVYLSREWPAGAGTSFWNHVTEGVIHTDETNVPLVQADMNDESKWVRSLTCQGLFNRILIHDARYWHCAEPVGGWGDSPQNGRVVLTCFFNTGGAK